MRITVTLEIQGDVEDEIAAVREQEAKRLWQGSCWLCDYTGESDYPENCCPHCGGCAMEWY